MKSKLLYSLLLSTATFATSATKEDKLVFAKRLQQLRSPDTPLLDINQNKTVEDWELILWSESYYHEFGITSKTDLKGVKLEKIPTKKDSWDLPGGFILRKDFDSLAKSLDKSDTAQVSFIRNFGSLDNTFSAQAALGRPLTVKSLGFKSIGAYSIDKFSLIPGISVDRIDGVGDGSLNETDVLTLGTGLSLDLVGNESSVFSFQRINIDLKWVGDTGFGNFSPKAELKWTPLLETNIFGLNTPYRPLPLIPAINYRNTFSTEFQIGDFDDEVQDGDRFVFGGATLGYYLKPEKFDRFEAFAQYTYLFELTNSSDVTYLEAGVRVDLLENQNVFLEAKYRKGEELEKFTTVDAFTVGLSFKF